MENPEGIILIGSFDQEGIVFPEHTPKFWVPQKSCKGQKSPPANEML